MKNKILGIYFLIAILRAIYTYFTIGGVYASKAYLIGLCIGTGLKWPFSLLSYLF